MIRGGAALWLTGLFAVALGCTTSDPSATRCRDIPQGGCPDDGLACNDPSCAALYSCNTDGTWGFVRACPALDAGAPAADATGASSNDANSAWDVGWIDAPPGANGGPGCVDLQPPDCTLGLALACAAGGGDPCCGCDTVFYCEDGGWSEWGVCTSDGGLVQVGGS
jgi:hypothetical protein